VRGDKEAGAISLRATDGIDHSANGPLTVCAGDVDDFGCRKARCGERRAFDTNAATTFADQPPNVFETKFNPKTLEAVKPGERLLVIQTGTRCHIHRAAAKYDNNRLISSRSFFRCTIMSTKPCSWRNSAV